MAVTTPVIGQTSWGDEANLAFSTLAQSGWNPNDLGMDVWTHDPLHVVVSTGTGLVSGTVRMVRLPRLAQAETISSVWVHCGIVGVTLTAGQCFLGLYNLAGTRLAVSASIEASFLATGIKQIALTVPYAASAGDDLLVAALFNGTTPPGLSASTTFSGVVNATLSTANARVADGPAGQTSLPASITMGTRTASAVGVWAAAG